MPLETLFISGPARAGKTTLAEVIAREVLERPAHYLRLRASTDRHTNEVEPADPVLPSGETWASAHLVRYTRDRVFEMLPEGLRAVRKIARSGFTIVEADEDPSLRHAYPYEYRLFVMAPPSDLHEVFRDPKASAQALREVMQDTAAFASEIFGVEAADLDDTAAGLAVREGNAELREGSMERMDISDIQMQQFLDSPLGAEIACRIQLQPEYYALVESDAAIINTGAGSGGALQACVNNLEKLLSRVRQEARRQSVLYWGDIQDEGDPVRQQLICRLRTLLKA